MDVALVEGQGLNEKIPEVSITDKTVWGHLSLHKDSSATLYKHCASKLPSHIYHMANTTTNAINERAVMNSA